MVHFDLDNPSPGGNMMRSSNAASATPAACMPCRILNAWGIPTVNTAAVAEACGDKLITTALLARANVPQPTAGWPSRPKSALEAIESWATR